VRAGAFPVAAAALLAVGCPSRPRLAPEERRGDAGPAVVVVERPRGATSARVPAREVQLTDEQEPNDDRAHAQPIELPTAGPARGVRGTLAASSAAPGHKAPRGDEDFFRLAAPAADAGAP